MPSSRNDVLQLATMSPAGGDFRYLGSVGHVSSLRHAFVNPGGADTLSCILQAPPDERDISIEPGRILFEIRAGGQIFEGVVQEPTPSDAGWDVSAQGCGNYGSNYRAVFSSWPSGIPDTPVNNAIALSPGPLRWVNPGVGTPSGLFTGTEVDSGADSITDLLNLNCSLGGLNWYVSTTPQGNILKVQALPTVPDRLIVSDSPVARTLGGFINVVYIRYQSSADNTTTGAAAVDATTKIENTASITANGRLETYIDVTSAGTLSAGAAQAIASAVLQRYQAASFAGPFTVYPNQLLNMGGQPVDIASEDANHVYQLVLTDYGYSVDVDQTPTSFLGGRVEYDDDADTLTITPFQYLRTDFAALLGAAVAVLPTSTA